VAGELSELLGHLRAAASTEAAETQPIPALAAVTVRALALIEGLCWDSLNRGDMSAFTRQAVVSAELHDFGVCAGLLREP